MKKWFVTWDRPEYKEWATTLSDGYLLVILRTEKIRYLCVKAELTMGETGLPAFKVIEEHYCSARTKALEQILEWRT